MSSYDGFDQHRAGPSHSTVNPAYVYEEPPSGKNYPQRRRVCTTRLVIYIILGLIVAGLATVIALLATGVISWKKSNTKTVTRSTYDPIYYGNLHPYLYPSELEELGIETDFDVIIVGAGLSGLAAAVALLQNTTLSILVLEARAEAGGRILSVPFGYGSVEVGAQWWTGADSNPISALADQFYSPRATFGSAFDRSLDAEAETAEWREEAGDADPQEGGTNGVEEIYLGSGSDGGAAAQARTLSSPLVFQTAVASAAPASFISDAFTEEPFNYTGLPAISLGNLSRVTAGLFGLVNSTANSARVQVDSRVSAIAISEFNATVELETGEAYRSQFVICTLPLGVLHEGAVAFDPPLPDVTLEAMSRLGVGTLNPVHLLFSAPFWSERDEVIRVAKSPVGGWVDFVSMYTFTGDALLVALPGISASSVMENQTDAEVVAAAVSALRLKYTSVPEPVDYLVTRWGLNPYSRGTHSYHAAGGTPAHRATLAEPVGSTLLFAGEATSTEHPSSLQGAFQTGVAQAARIAGATLFPVDEPEGECTAECYSSGDVDVPIDEEAPLLEPEDVTR